MLLQKKYAKSSTPLMNQTLLLYPQRACTASRDSKAEHPGSTAEAEKELWSEACHTRAIPGQPGGVEEGFYLQKDQRRQVEGMLCGTIHNHKDPSSWNIQACWSIKTLHPTRAHLQAIRCTFTSSWGKRLRERNQSKISLFPPNEDEAFILSPPPKEECQENISPSLSLMEMNSSHMRVSPFHPVIWVHTKGNFHHLASSRWTSWRGWAVLNLSYCYQCHHFRCYIMLHCHFHLQLHWHAVPPASPPPKDFESEGKRAAEELHRNKRGRAIVQPSTLARKESETTKNIKAKEVMLKRRQRR